MYSAETPNRTDDSTEKTNTTSSSLMESPSYFNEIDNDLIQLDAIIQTKVSRRLRELGLYFENNPSFITENRDPNTNIINLAGKKTYNIPPVHMPKFFQMLELCRLEKRMIHFQEKQSKDYSGIMLDFDRYQMGNEREIKEIHFVKLIGYIFHLLNTFIDFKTQLEKIYTNTQRSTTIKVERADNDALEVSGDLKSQDNSFNCKVFIIRKPNVEQDTKEKYTAAASKIKGTNVPFVYKDGFHILIPQIWVSRVFKKFLISELVSKGYLAKSFSSITCDIQPVNEMMDVNSSFVNVCFYGCSKFGKPSYALESIFDVNCDLDAETIPRVTTLPKTLLKNYNLIYEMSLCHFYEDFYVVAGGEKAEVPNMQLMSTFLNKHKFEYRTELETRINLYNEKTANATGNDAVLDEISSESDISIITMNDVEANLLYKLLQIIDIDFADDYSKWRNVVFAIADTNLNYKPLAIWFSQRKPGRYNASDFNKLWESAVSHRGTSSSITKRSIYYFARQCNPQKFDEIYQLSYQRLLEKYVYDFGGVIEQGMVANLLHNILSYKFVVDTMSSTGSKDGYFWWEFVTPGQSMKRGEIYKWRREIQPDSIHIYINESLPKIYAQTMQKIKDRKDAAKSDNDVKVFASVEKTFKMYTTKLFNNNFQNGVIKQAEYRFRKRGFAESLDNYDDVIGVSNGILKLTPEPTLIKSFHEYAISKYTAADYIPYDPNNPYVQLLEKAYEDTFPEPDAREFWKLYHSQFIDPSEADAVFGQQVGGGSNGKSFWVELISNTIGEMYSIKLPLGLLTAAREKPGETNTALMSAEGKYFIYFSEPNGPEALNSGRLKEMFGGEKQTGNDKYGKQKSFKMRASPIAISNYDFTTDCTDHGFWRRNYYYRVKVKYCANPNPNNPYEKKRDLKFISVYKKDPDVMNAMMSIMVHNNNILRNKYGGSIENVNCDTIKKETEEFRNRQDTINRFITKMIIRVPADNKKETPLVEIAKAYINWHEMEIKKLKDPDVETICSKFENSYLASYLVRKVDTSLVLTKHRIKDLADNLKEGESYIGLSTRVPELKDNIDPRIVLRDDSKPGISSELDNVYVDPVETPILTVVSTVQPKVQDNSEDFEEHCNNIAQGEQYPVQGAPTPINLVSSSSDRSSIEKMIN